MYAAGRAAETSAIFTRARCGACRPMNDTTPLPHAATMGTRDGAGEAGGASQFAGIGLAVGVLLVAVVLAVASCIAFRRERRSAGQQSYRRVGEQGTGESTPEKTRLASRERTPRQTTPPAQGPPRTGLPDTLPDFGGMLANGYIRTVDTRALLAVLAALQPHLSAADQAVCAAVRARATNPRHAWMDTALRAGLARILAEQRVWQ